MRVMAATAPTNAGVSSDSATIPFPAIDAKTANAEKATEPVPAIMALTTLGILVAWLSFIIPNCSSNSPSFA